MANLNQTKKEFKKQTLGYITAAFGLVAALAWNDAISALIEHLFSIEKNSVSAKLVYALIVTLVVVFISFYLAKLFKEEN
jgi:uncharacterized membrane protein YidH (DUF202 family)